MVPKTKKPITIRYILLVTLLGNTLQWYDYHVFFFLVPIFTQVFFPSLDIQSNLFFSFLIYGTSAIARVIGAIFFGLMGDLLGRRTALLISISLMTFPMIGIALLPPFSVIGWAAPVLLLVFRFFQGIAAGGELTGGIVYLIESSPPEKRGFYGSFSFFGVGLAVLIAYMDLFFFHTHYENPNAFWWRSVYFIGSAVGLLVLILRKKFHETHLFQEEVKTKENPLALLFKNHKTSFFKTCGIAILDASGFALLIGFFPVYWNKVIGFPLDEALFIQFLGVFFFPFFIIYFGNLSKFIGIRRQALLFVSLFALLALPFFVGMKYGSLDDQIILYSVILGLFAGYYSVLPGIFCSLFPTRVRYTGVSIGYNTSLAIFGGLSPTAIIALTRWIPGILDMGIYLTLMALAALFSLLWSKGKYLSIEKPE